MAELVSPSISTSDVMPSDISSKVPIETKAAIAIAATNELSSASTTAAATPEEKEQSSLTTKDPETLLQNAISQSMAVHDFRTRLAPSSIRETRYILQIAPEHVGQNLTVTTLAGPNRISVPPYVFLDERKGELLAFYHLGTQLAGHASMVHGGMMAVLLDECMGRACFSLLPNRIAVTAKLDLSYRAPIAVDSVVMIKARTEKIEGRKAFVEAEVVNPSSGLLLLEAKALFIEPRWAAEMSKVV